MRSPPLTTFGTVFAVGGVFACVQGVSSHDPKLSLFGLLFVAVGTLLLLSGIANIRVSREFRRLVSTRLSSSGTRTDAVRTPAAVPPGPLTLVDHRLTERATIDARIPRGLSTLFLWVFDASPTMSLMRRLARVGPVYLLRGGGLLVDDLMHGPRMAFGKIDRFIEESEAEVLQRIETFRGRNRNFLGDHRMNSMICSDDVWKFALSRLLERAAIVVVDLSDFTPGHAGIEYELAVLLDEVPLGRVIFVVGPHTDRAAFDATVDRLWVTLPQTSPNYSTDQVKMHVAATTSLDISVHASDEGARSTQDRELDMIVGIVGEAMLQVPPQDRHSDHQSST